jgi:hypothetical protein
VTHDVSGISDAWRRARRVGVACQPVRDGGHAVRVRAGLLAELSTVDRGRRPDVDPGSVPAAILGSSPRFRVASRRRTSASCRSGTTRSRVIRSRGAGRASCRRSILSGSWRQVPSRFLRRSALNIER